MTNDERAEWASAPPSYGLALPDRVTRLEVLRETDRERAAALADTVHRMDGKLDTLLSNWTSQAGTSAAWERMFGGMVPAAWVAAFTALVGIAHYLLTGKLLP